MRIAYVGKRFSAASMRTIRQANDIIEQYAAQGFDLTLRQLYYQFVSRGIIANKDSEYKKLGSVVNDARLAGYIDWDRIQDRTRNVKSLSHWENPSGVIASALASYHLDMWEGQKYQPEVWIEKDALVGVIEPACRDLDVSYFSCRGYTSQSEMWAAAQRLRSYHDKGRTPVILHLGDHDPSGIDMSRDIRDRLRLFLRGGALVDTIEWGEDGKAKDGYETEVFRDPVPIKRLALNMEQVNQYDPPPNPAKITDSRAVEYIRIHGNESWELDALEPSVIDDLIRTAIESYRDDDTHADVLVRQMQDKTLLKKASERWESVADFLDS